MATTNVLTAPEVAAILQVNVETVYRLARKGELPCFHLGTAVRFSEKRILEWIHGEEQ